jgi:hypothetical protein
VGSTQRSWVGYHSTTERMRGRPILPVPKPFLPRTPGYQWSVVLPLMRACCLGLWLWEQRADPRSSSTSTPGRNRLTFFTQTFLNRRRCIFLRFCGTFAFFWAPGCGIWSRIAPVGIRIPHIAICKEKGVEATKRSGSGFEVVDVLRRLAEWIKQDL